MTQMIRGRRYSWEIPVGGWAGTERWAVIKLADGNEPQYGRWAAIKYRPGRDGVRHCIEIVTCPTWGAAYEQARTNGVHT